jgi:hypothetical protein
VPTVKRDRAFRSPPSAWLTRGAEVKEVARLEGKSGSPDEEAGSVERLRVQHDGVAFQADYAPRTQAAK